MDRLLLITPDRRWRVCASARKAGLFDLIEVQPNRHTFTHLEAATLLDVVNFLEDHGVDAETLEKA